MSRMLQLTLPAPVLVEAIHDGRQSEGVRLEDLLERFSVEWTGRGQRSPYRVIFFGRREAPIRVELTG